MANSIVYRTNIDYYSKDYDNKCCEISTPHGDDLREAMAEYISAIENEKCFDDPEKPVRACVVKYEWTPDENGEFTSLAIETLIARNY